jgi:hypothetical protein
MHGNLLVKGSDHNHPPMFDDVYETEYKSFEDADIFEWLKIIGRKSKNRKLKE